MLSINVNISQIFEKYNEEIYRYFYLRTRSKEISEDLASEVFIKFLKSNYDDKKSSIRTYLYIIARSILIDYYYKSKHSGTTKIGIDIDKENLSYSDKDYQTILEDFYFVISLLNREDREIMILRYVNDLSIKEISNVLNLTISNVKVKIHRSLKILKRKVNEK